MKKVIDIIEEISNDGIVRKKKDIELFETGLMDSMSFLRFLMECEEQYGIEIDVSTLDMNNLRTVNDMVKYIENLLEN